MKSEHSDFSHLPLLSPFTLNSLFFPRYQAPLSFRKASMLPSLQSEKKTGQDSLHAVNSSCQAVQHMAVQIQGKEQNDCVTFHLQLRLPCESFLPCSLIDPSRRLTLQQQPTVQQWNNGNNGNNENQVVAKPKAVVALSGGAWKLLIWSLCRESKKIFKDHPAEPLWNLKGNQTCTWTQENCAKIQLPPVAVSQSTSRASLLYLDKKMKEREDRTFHTLLSLLKDESKEGFF